MIILNRFKKISQVQLILLGIKSHYFIYLRNSKASLSPLKEFLITNATQIKIYRLLIWWQWGNYKFDHPLCFCGKSAINLPTLVLIQSFADLEINCIKCETLHYRFLQWMWPNLHFPADLITFTEEILKGKLHFLCSDNLEFSLFWLNRF